MWGCRNTYPSRRILTEARGNEETPQAQTNVILGGGFNYALSMAARSHRRHHSCMLAAENLELALLASRQCSYGAGVEEFERELGLLVVRVARPNNGVMCMV